MSFVQGASPRLAIGIAALLLLHGAAFAGQRSGKPLVTEAQAAGSGPGHPWQSRAGGVNLFSLSKQTTVPLVAWGVRGGMPLGLALFHNGQALFSNPHLASNWRHSHDIQLFVWNEGGLRRAAVVWGDHTVNLFVRNPTWMPADGYRNVLQEVGSGYSLTLKNQVVLSLQRVPPLGPAINIVADYRIASVADPNGNVIAYQYDSLNRLIQVTDPSGRAILFEYAAGRIQATRFAAPGGYMQSWSYVYDAMGRLIRIELPVVTTAGGPQSYAAQFAYDALGNLTSLTDPLGNVWQYGYAGNRIAFAQWPLNTSAQRVLYSAAGNSRTVADPLGREYDYDFDGAGRLVATRDPGNFQSSLTYLDPTFTWSPSMVTNPAGDVTRFDYDARGNVVGAIDPAGERWDSMYDGRNNVTRVEEPLVTNAWGMVEPGRHRTDYVYDANDNRTQRIAYTGPTTSVVTNYTHDAFGQLVSATDPLNHTWVYAYDAYGNLVQAATPEGSNVRWHYDTAARSTGFTVPNARTDPVGQRTNMNRDEWGRLRVLDFPSGPDNDYHYDGLGRLVRMNDATGMTDFTFDANGRLTGAFKSPWLCQYTYFANGLRATMFENSGAIPRNVLYNYSNRNLLQAITDAGATTQFTYDQSGRVVRRDLGNGARTQCQFVDGRLATVTHLDIGMSTFFDVFVEYQDNGQSMRETQGANVTRYGYDFQGRIVREERVGAPAFTNSYQYDADGNRVLAARNGPPTIYMYDMDHRLLQANPPAMAPDLYFYDNNSRLRRRERNNNTEIHEFEYDHVGNLLGIDRWSGAIFEPLAQYEYDGIGNRVRRLRYAPGGILDAENRFFFDGGVGSMVREDRVVQGNPSTHLMTWNFHWGGLLSSRDSTGPQTWAAADVAGNLRTSTNGLGQPSGLNMIYNAFGEVVFQNGNPGPYQFGADFGLRAEGDAGLYHMPGAAGRLREFYDLGAIVGSDHAWGSHQFVIPDRGEQSADVYWCSFYDPKLGQSLATGPNIGGGFYLPWSYDESDWHHGLTGRVGGNSRYFRYYGPRAGYSDSRGSFTVSPYVKPEVAHQIPGVGAGAGRTSISSLADGGVDITRFGNSPIISTPSTFLDLDDFISTRTSSY